MDPFFTRPLVGSVPISSPFDSLLLIDLKIEYSPRGGESRDYDDGYGNNVVESNTHRSFLYELVRVSYSRPKFPAICVRFVTIADLDLRKKQSSERMMVGRGAKEVRF